MNLNLTNEFTFFKADFFLLNDEIQDKVIDR